MTADQDKDPDGELDTMAGSMRAMWRDLPDEEPPSRGLADLMAAARSKAAEMQPAKEQESWWRRSFALLLRPPMLAVATVVVLIGGAVVLNQRGTAVTTATKQTEPVALERARDRGVIASPELPKPADPPTPSAAVDGTAPAPPAVVRRPSRRLPIVQEPIKEVAPAADPPSEPPRTDAEKPASGGMGDSKLEIAGDEESEPTTTAVKGTRIPERAPAPTTDHVPLSPSSGRPQVSTAQLIKQAETAAGRNDCPAVRATAERIRKLDANVYRTRVATQPAIARCLK